jgi:N-acetylmuramoyl-L-alanine amidase
MGSAWIQPLMYFELMNVPLFRGAYLIHRVSHSITPGNMVTTITGVRQNRYSSRYVSKGYYTADNITNGYSDANVYNSSNNTSSTNCGYERFEPKSMIPQSSDVDFSRDIEVLKNYVGDWYNKDSKVAYNNTWEAILGTCIGEAGNQGELGVKLVATSLYLRGGKVGWKKTLVKQQFNGLGNKSPNEETYKQIVDRVTEMFTKSPLILVGKKTDLTITNTLDNNKSVTYNPVIICEGGKSTNKSSESGVEITEQMIRNLVCFVATGDNFYDNMALTTPQKKSKFFFQHGGHVFHSNTTLEQYNSQTKPYWDGNNNAVKSGDDTKTDNTIKSGKKLKSATPPISGDVTVSLFTDKTKEELNLSDNAIACYRAITKTAKVVTKFDYDKNGLKVLEKSSGNTVYLSTNTNANNSFLFDIILKTYQNECSEISWVTDDVNTQKDEPICVKIVCEEKNNKVVSITNNLNQQLKLNGSLPENVKKSLYGKYIPFTDNKDINNISKSIQSSKMLKECKIFDDNFIKDMNKVSEIFKDIVCVDCQKTASTGGKSSSNGQYEYFNQVVDLNNLIKTNRKINLIVVHTSANSPKSDDPNSPDFNKSVANTEMIRQWETSKGFSDIAYHYVIERDGTIKFGRDINVVGAHTKGKNKNSIGICYVGGINKNSKATDNRTVKQKESLIKLLEKLKSMYNLTDSDIAGHYKYASKPCPCFLIPEELKK